MLFANTFKNMQTCLKIKLLKMHMKVYFAGKVQDMKPVQNCTSFIFVHFQRLNTFNSLSAGNFFTHVCRLLIFFSKSTFRKNSFGNNIRVSTSLDPDQAWHFVRPYLSPNCLERLSADDTRRTELTMVLY